jgi:hypothetical protein
MITRAISLHESLFSDPITIQIRFRYSTTAPDGTPLPMGTLARTDLVTYQISWSTYINALKADATTSNDTQANASLPGTTLSPNVQPSARPGEQWDWTRRQQCLQMVRLGRAARTTPL